RAGMGLIVENGVPGDAGLHGRNARVGIDVKTGVVAGADVYRNAVAFFEGDGRAPEVHAELNRLVGRHHGDRFRFLAIAEPGTDGVVEYEGFIAVGIDIDDFDHEVRVG